MDYKDSLFSFINLNPGNQTTLEDNEFKSELVINFSKNPFIFISFLYNLLMSSFQESYLLNYHLLNKKIESIIAAPIIIRVLTQSLNASLTFPRSPFPI